MASRLTAGGGGRGGWGGRRGKGEGEDNRRVRTEAHGRVAAESAELAGGSLARNERGTLQSLESAFRVDYVSLRNSVSRRSRIGHRRARRHVTAQSCPHVLPAPGGPTRACLDSRVCLAGNGRDACYSSCFIYAGCQRKRERERKRRLRPVTPPLRIGILLRAVCNSSFSMEFPRAETTDCVIASRMCPAVPRRA